MRRLLGVAVLTAPLLIVLAAPASAGQSRMTLDCGGDLGSIERTNGLSWWGDDDTVYTTKYLRVADENGFYERSYGHVAGQHVICTAEHDVGSYESTWTVHLVRAR